MLYIHRFGDGPSEFALFFPAVRGDVSRSHAEPMWERSPVLLIDSSDQCGLAADGLWYFGGTLSAPDRGACCSVMPRHTDGDPCFVALFPQALASWSTHNVATAAPLASLSYFPPAVLNRLTRTLISAYVARYGPVRRPVADLVESASNVYGFSSPDLSVRLRRITSDAMIVPTNAPTSGPPDAPVSDGATGPVVVLVPRRLVAMRDHFFRPIDASNYTLRLHSRLSIAAENSTIVVNTPTAWPVAASEFLGVGGAWYFAVANRSQIDPSAESLLAAPSAEMASAPRTIKARCAHCYRTVQDDQMWRVTDALAPGGVAWRPRHPGSHLPATRARRAARASVASAPAPGAPASESAPIQAFVCRDCHNSFFSECTVCSRLVVAAAALVPADAEVPCWYVTTDYDDATPTWFSPEQRATRVYCGDSVVCESCRSSRNAVTECGMCHEPTVAAQMIETDRSPSERVCQPCYRDHYAACSDCGSDFPRADLVTRTVVSSPARRSSTASRTLCPTCWRSYRTCDRCGFYYYSPTTGRNGGWVDFDEDEDYEDDTAPVASPACPSCFPALRVHGHDYRPAPNFYHTAADDRAGPQATRLYLGWELEVENERGADRSTALRTIEAPWLYAKHDGSLDTGFEIVSHPMTYDWMRENRGEFARRWRALVRLGFRSYQTTTCGLHVHLSRAAFTPLQLYRFQKLFYDNARFVMTVSQRTSVQVERWCSLTAEGSPGKALNKALLAKAAQKTTNMASAGRTRWDYVRQMYVIDNAPIQMLAPDAEASVGNGSAARYVAVNCEPGHTVEVRLFRGTLNVESFFKAIQFCVAAFHFAREHTTEQVTESQFCAYVLARRKEYPDLAAFLVARVTGRSTLEANNFERDATPARATEPTPRARTTAADALATAEAKRLERRRRRAQERDARQQRAAAAL